MLSAYLTAPALHTEKDLNFFTLNINGKGGKMNFEKKGHNTYYIWHNNLTRCLSHLLSEC